MFTVDSREADPGIETRFRCRDSHAAASVRIIPSSADSSVMRWSNTPLPQGGTSSGWLHPDISAEIRSELQFDPETWIRIQGTVIKPRPLGTVFAVSVRCRGEERLCYIKERRYQNWYMRLLQRLGVSGLNRASRVAEPLIQKGIPTPPVWGFITIRRHRETQEYLLTEGIAQAISLDQFLVRNFRQFNERRRRDFRHALARELAGLVRRLHRAGFENRDLKATNLMIQSVGAGAREFSLQLIDLEGVRRWGVMPRFRRIYNLTRLNLSLSTHGEFTRTDCLRFLRNYIQGESQSLWKQYWCRIMRQTQKRRELAARSGKTVH